MVLLTTLYNAIVKIIFFNPDFVVLIFKINTVNVRIYIIAWKLYWVKIWKDRFSDIGGNLGAKHFGQRKN